MSTLFTVTLPDIGEGVVEGEVIEWLKPVGSAVAQDEPVVIVMTDKATVELPAPHPGTIAKHYHKAGEVAKLGKPLYDIQLEGEVKQEGIKALPKVRHQAREMNIDLATVTPSGKNGRILEADLHIPHFSGDTDVPLIGIRGLMAKRMTQSNNDIPHFSFFEQADAIRLIQLRQNVSKAALEAGIHLTYMPFFIRALSLTINRFPEMNSSLHAKNLVLHKPHHIGIAVASPHGLIVPVLKDVQTMGLEQVIRSYDQLMKKAKEGKLAPNELKEGTITLSNYGVLGSGGRWATPIINPPEVAILGVARIFKTPVAKNDKVVVGEVLNLSWSFDHRVIDGSLASQISHFFVQLIQNPASLL
jgi:pyruvate/2-oxoglutarate dehydrogenase complex dihydrolipoamide acyltransferase (E2) component